MSTDAVDVNREHANAEGAAFSRWAAAASVLLVVSVAFGLSLVPVSIDLGKVSVAGFHPANFSVPWVNVHKCEAHANPVAGAGVALIEEYAAAAGLSSSQFVATVAGATAMGGGMAVANETGVKMSASLSSNLENLVNAADYPEWDSLTDSQKAIYGNSREEYDAQKFCELLKAFGQESVVAEYFDTYDGTGGGSFNPDDTQSEVIKTLGRVGNRWLLGLGNNVTAISDLIDKITLADFLGINADADVLTFDAEGVANWPENMPQTLNMIKTSQFELKNPGVARKYLVTDEPVYAMMLHDGEKHYQAILFQDENFKRTGWANSSYANAGTPTIDATQLTRYEITVYEYDFSATQGSAGYPSTNIPINLVTPLPTNQDVILAAALIIGAGGASSGVEPTVPDYPADPEGNVYFPSDGVNGDTSWNQFITPTEIVRPDNDFNPGNETGTDEWKDETEANVLPLEGIHFDKLFPFCLVYDMQLFLDKLRSLGALPSQSNENQGEGLNTQADDEILDGLTTLKIELSGFGVVDEGDGIEFDLLPLYDLLLLIRPAIQALLIISLLWTIIKFWQGVIAG